MADAAAAAGAAGAAEVAEIAARWLDALQRVAGRAAHEINNALNGAVVNLEVVRLRAVPGKDAGAAAPFAQAGAGQLEGAVRFVEALTGLTRAPRGAPDAAATLRQLATLLAPVAAHDGVTLHVEAELAAPTSAPAAAVRWALAETLLVAIEAARAAAPVTGAESLEVPAENPIPAAGVGGLDGALPAPAAARVVRCVLHVAPDPTVRVHGPASVHLAGDALDVLRTCGIDVGYEGPTLILAFPPIVG